LSVDDSPADVERFLKGREQPWAQAFLGSWADDTVARAYGIESIPAVLLLDPDGKIIARDMRGEAIARVVASALEGKP